MGCGLNGPTFFSKTAGAEGGWGMFTTEGAGELRGKPFVPVLAATTAAEGKNCEDFPDIDRDGMISD
jgi:hypothetical protein